MNLLKTYVSNQQFVLGVLPKICIYRNIIDTFEIESNLPFIILYDRRICPILLAGDVADKPMEQRRAPASDIFRQEKARIRGPTKSPEKLMSASKALMISAEPVVSTSIDSKMSPKRRPNDCSMDLVQSWKFNVFSLIIEQYRVIHYKVYTVSC